MGLACRTTFRFHPGGSQDLVQVSYVSDARIDFEEQRTSRHYLSVSSELALIGGVSPFTNQGGCVDMVALDERK